jgi:hypothetical protein
LVSVQAYRWARRELLDGKARLNTAALKTEGVTTRVPGADWWFDPSSEQRTRRAL